MGQRPFLEEQFMKLIPENLSGDSFYTLINGQENYLKIADSMRSLPGVHKVEVLTEVQIKEEVKNIFSNLNMTNNLAQLDLNYAGLKIVFKKDLKPRAKELVRDYLTHLAGENNAILGAIKSVDSTEEKKNQMIKGIKDWGFSIFILTMVIFWFISLLLVKAKVLEAAYLLESFQRRSKIALKMAIAGLCLIFFSFSATTLVLGIPKINNLALTLVLFVIGMSFFSSKYHWESRS